MTKNKCGYQMHIFVTSFSKQHAPVWRCFCMVQPLRQPFRPKCTNRILQMHQQNPVVPSESGVHPQNPVCTYSVVLWRSRDGSVWGLFRAREVTPARWQCFWCCFVPARWPILRWHDVWVLFCARQMTDPEMAACGINSVCLVRLLIPWHLTGSSIDWTDTTSSNKWSSVVRLCVYICCFYYTVPSYDMSVQMIKYHSQTTPSAPSHPLRHPRTGVVPTHLWLLADWFYLSQYWS